jgi:hypothetical protein
VCCEHLVCASCAHAVVDGHCPVCRAARDRMHRSGAPSSATLLLAIAVLVSLAAVLSAHLAR